MTHFIPYRNTSNALHEVSYSSKRLWDYMACRVLLFWIETISS